MNYYKIGQRIRKYRKACQLSQEQLSEAVGISTTHLSHIETGNTKLSLAVLVKISQELSVRTDDLLFDSPNTAIADKDDILNLLNSCTPEDIKILKDILRATKIALEKHKQSNP